MAVDQDWMKLTYQQTAAPRTCLGVDSDTYNGIKTDMAPTPSPATHRPVKN